MYNLKIEITYIDIILIISVILFGNSLTKYIELNLTYITDISAIQLIIFIMLSVIILPLLKSRITITEGIYNKDNK